MVRSRNTSKAKSRVRKVGAAVTAVAAVAGGMVFAATPASANANVGANVSASANANGSADFVLDVGASYYKGTATWYNRSVVIDGLFKATGCRRIYAEAYAGNTGLGLQSTSTWCDRSGPQDFALSADVVGGSDNVYIYMTDENLKFIEGRICFRDFGPCIIVLP